MVVKAVSEQGVRLNIRKETLGEWRREFARHLREQGIAANAPDRFLRGETKPHKFDGIYRPMRDLKQHSSHMQQRVESVAADLSKGNLRVESYKGTLMQTRQRVGQGWPMVREILAREGRAELADRVGRFVATLPPARTEREHIAAELLGRTRGSRVRDAALTR